MSGQLESYREEILNFLRTVTIKYEPFAHIMGKQYMLMHGITDPHGSWNPYYINLTGEYASNDQRMYVYSIEEERTVPFDRDLALNYPKTAALYRLPNAEYRTLEEQYPNNRGLIRNIVYPAGTMDDVLAAPNLSLLSYDASTLEFNERDDLVSYLKSFLDMVRVRWWVPEYDSTTDDMFAMTFWLMLWQHLPLLLLSRRIQNIRTPYVHSFHIWEELKSHGLADYRDVLTKNQALWLYRNIHYILQNQGKTSNLALLAQNLLGEVFVSLIYKDMYQETATKWEDELLTNPDFLSFDYATHEHVMTESFPILNNRLVDLNYEYRNGGDFIAQTETDLATHNYNILPTKYLEFKKESINTANAVLMTNFFIDTLMYRLSCNDLAYKLEFIDSNTGTTIEATPKDLVLLWHYAAVAYYGETPKVIPTKYKCHIAFKRTKITSDELYKNIWYGGSLYNLDSMVNTKVLLSKITWYDKRYVDVTEFTEDTVANLRVIMAIQRIANGSNDLILHRALDLFERQVMVNDTVTLNLTTAEDFDAWRQTVPVIDELLAEYEDEHNQEYYATLTQQIFDVLFPLDEATTNEFLGSLRGLEKIYSAIRDLFIQLGSYNVTYLETARDVPEYIMFDDADIMYPVNSKYTYNPNWVHEFFEPVIRLDRELHTKRCINHDINVSTSGTTHHINGELDSNITVDITTHHHRKTRPSNDVNINITKQYTVKYTVGTDVINAI